MQQYHHPQSSQQTQATQSRQQYQTVAIDNKTKQKYKY